MNGLLTEVENPVDVAKVEDALKALGASSTEIAVNLANAGIRGKRGCEHSCAVAEYVSREFGGEWHVDSGFAYQYAGSNIAYLPAPVEDFIEDFDRNRYPQLVRGD